MPVQVLRARKAKQSPLNRLKLTDKIPPLYWEIASPLAEFILSVPKGSGSQ